MVNSKDSGENWREMEENNGVFTKKNIYGTIVSVIRKSENDN